MALLGPLLGTLLGVLVGPFILFGAFLLLLTIPWVQRNALYAHKINTLLWSKLDEPCRWGFAAGQVTPFSLVTPDGETLYAWHVLPLPLYMRHEDELGGSSSIEANHADSRAFKLLKDDPDSALVLYFHGNLGHIAQAVRPATFQALTNTSRYHVVAIDYRGFGRSTGSPTENGLIMDAQTVIEWAINVARVPPHRIVLLGHSLGTAVVSGVTERYAMQGVAFAGIVLVAGFGDLASMLGGYRMFGLIPVLGPFALWQRRLIRLLDKVIVDKWHSARRLASIVKHTETRLRITLLHARNDTDIPFSEDDKLFRAAVSETVGIMTERAFNLWMAEHTPAAWRPNNGYVRVWTVDTPDIVIRQELFPHGGHNDVSIYAPMVMAVLRSFEG